MRIHACNGLLVAAPSSLHVSIGEREGEQAQRGSQPAAFHELRTFARASVELGHKNYTGTILKNAFNCLDRQKYHSEVPYCAPIRTPALLQTLGFYYRMRLRKA